MTTRTLAIFVASLAVIAAGGITACVAYTDADGTGQNIIVEDHFPPAIDAGDLIEPPELRGDFDIGGGVTLPPFDQVELPPGALEQTVDIEFGVDLDGYDELGIAAPEPEVCGETVCGAVEVCCPAYGICVPDDCYDCCDRLARGEPLEEPPTVLPDIDPWPGGR